MFEDLDGSAYPQIDYSAELAPPAAAPLDAVLASFSSPDLRAVDHMGQQDSANMAESLATGADEARMFIADEGPGTTHSDGRGVSERNDDDGKSYQLPVTYDSDGDPTTVTCPNDGPDRCPGGGGSNGDGGLPPQTPAPLPDVPTIPPGGGGGSGGDNDDSCAGYDGDGDGVNDIVPEGIDEMRGLVDAAADDLRSLSDNAIPGPASVEYGAFIIRGADGVVRMPEPFTSMDSGTIPAEDIIAAAIQAMGPGDTLIGFVHTHQNSGAASVDDALATNSTLPNAAAAAGASSTPWLVNYIVGPDGNVQEYTKQAITDPDRVDTGVDLDAAMNEGSSC